MAWIGRSFYNFNAHFFAQCAYPKEFSAAMIYDVMFYVTIMNVYHDTKLDLPKMKNEYKILN